jgi:hypothetical protein
MAKATQRQLQQAVNHLGQGKETLADICKKMNILVGDVQHYMGKLQKAEKAKTEAAYNEVYTQCKEVWREHGEIALEVFRRILNEA